MRSRLDKHQRNVLIRSLSMLLQGFPGIKSPVGNDRLAPYILISGDHPLKASLVVDKRVIDYVPIEELPFVLLSAFFVYNICYPRGCCDFYSMMEILVLNYSTDKASPTVKNLLPKILPPLS